MTCMHEMIPMTIFNILEDFDFLYFLSATVLLYIFEVKASSNQSTFPAETPLHSPATHLQSHPPPLITLSNARFHMFPPNLQH